MLGQLLLGAGTATLVLGVSYGSAWAWMKLEDVVRRHD